jgi:LysR family transcriptional activator of glutamate synthase operon
VFSSLIIWWFFPNPNDIFYYKFIYSLQTIPILVLFIHKWNNFVEDVQMELGYLYEFSIVARCENFSLAAEELFISQSSLSKHIKSLETELGVSLFDRTTRSVRLNEYGRILLPYAEQIFSQFQTCVGQLQKKQEAHRGSLLVASIPVMAQYGITEALSSFRMEHPELTLSVAEHEACQIDELLSRGECDLAFQRFPASEESPYQEMVFCTDTLVAVLPEEHPLARSGVLPLAQLKNDVFLLLDENTRMHDMCVQACAAANFTPEMAYKGHRPENIIGLVARGMGVSLLMRRQAEFYKNPGIVCLELAENVSSRISLIWKKGRVPSPAAQTFISYMARYGKM